MLIGEKGYEKVSITELCQKAKVPRNTFYRYFADKKSVLKYLYNRTLYMMVEKALQTCETDQELDIINAMAYWLQYYRENDPLWDIFKESRHILLFEQLVHYYVKMIDPLYKWDFSNQQTKKMVFLAYGTQGILDAWKHTGYVQSEKEVASQIYHILKTPMVDYMATGKRAQAVISEIHNQDIFTE